MALVAGLTAASGTAGVKKPAASKSPYNILYVATISGPLGAQGKSFLDGAVAGARILNASGGILGHHVTLKIVDSGSDPAKAVTLVQQALGGSTKYQQIATDFGVISSAVAPLIAANPNVFGTGASATVTETVQAVPNMYFTGPTQLTQADGAITQAKKTGYKSVGVMAIDNANGRSYGGYYKQLAAQYGLTFHEGYVPAGTLDATPQVQQVLASNPDVLILAGSISASTILPARAKLGATIPVLCDQGCAGSANWASLAGPALTGVKILTLPYLVLNDPATKTFAYKQYLKYLNQVESDHGFGLNAGLTSYAGLLIARAAARKCNCIDPAKMVKTLETVATSKDVPGWIGPSTLFSPSVHSLIYPPSSYVTAKAAPVSPQGFWIR